MQKSDQKLIVIHGSHNCGKTILYNLFKNEGGYICLDLYKPHYKVYEQQSLEQLGKKNYERLKKYILSNNTSSTVDLCNEITFMMNQFSDYDFVIKPGMSWANWNYFMEFSPVKLENIKHFHVFRHPKIWLATCYNKKLNIEDFILNVIGNYQDYKDSPETHHLIKIEDIKYNSLLKTLLKNTNLDNLLPYTIFDLNIYRTNIFNRFDDFKNDLKIIEIKLKEVLQYLKYDIEDVNTLIYLEKLYNL